MLKKEHIRQAIGAIAVRNAEAGYTLDEMLNMDRIRLAPAGANLPSGDDFYLIFDDRPVAVKKVLFFNQGTVPIEERLLIKYGEMLMQHQLSRSTSKLNFLEAAAAVRQAGLRLMVIHEIDIALEGLVKAAAEAGANAQGLARRSERLQAIKVENPVFRLSPTGDASASEVTTIFCGSVDDNLPAYFMLFPFCMDALLQAADINLEFFNIRFLLSCWMRGLEPYLFAGVVNDKIEGMVYLTFKKGFLYKALEIQYIATARGRPAGSGDPGRRELKGVGAFLVAGVWLLWKNHLSDCKDLLLDSEIGARRFYERIGFQSRGASGFMMKQPGGRLLPVILEMAAHHGALPARTEAAISKLLQQQLHLLSARARREKDIQARQDALAAVRMSLQAGISPAITQMVQDYLAHNHRKIPEAQPGGGPQTHFQL